MASIAELFVKISADADDALKGLDKFQDNLSKVQGGAEKAGKSLTQNVTAPIVGIATAAVATGMKFDDAMAQVQATSGATGKDFDKMRDAAIKMGSETAFSASQSADALNYLALAGYDADKAVEALPKVLQLASAGGLDLAYASDLVTDSMSALGLESSELDGFIDKMAKTSQKSNTNVAQLGEAILTVGGTAKTMAGGVDEMNTVLGILADNGIKGSEGGTALRNMILSLSAPTDTAKAAIEGLGLSVYDANGNMRPMNDIFNDLNGTLSTMSQGEQTEVLSTIFNKVDLKSANALLANSGARFNELSMEIGNADGTAASMAETMEGTTAGAFRSLASATEGIMIMLSDELKPIVDDMIIPALERFADWIKGLIEKFRELEPEMQKKIAVITGIVVAIGPALLIISKLIAFVKIVITVVKTVILVFKGLAAVFAFILSPIGLVVAAVAAVIAIGVLLWKNWDKVKEFASIMWEKVKEIFHKLKTGVVENMTKVINTVKEIPGKILDALKGLGTSMLNIGKDIMNGLWKGISGMGDWVKRKVTGLMDKIVPGPIKKLFGINSPSKLFAEYGENLNEGLVVGMEDSSRMVDRASEAMANTVIDGFNGPSIGSSVDQEYKMLDNKITINISNAEGLDPRKIAEQIQFETDRAFNSKGGVNYAY